MVPRVLVVEDDEPLGREIERTLGGAGFAVRRVARGDQALDEDLSTFGLVVLDLMLPGRHGLDVLKAARRDGHDVPVLILSARSDATDKVRALELGADDYLTKPFWPEELLARVRARLRRPILQTDGPIEIGELTIDPAGRVVTIGEIPIEMTRTEFEILALLAARPGVAVSRDALVRHALEPGGFAAGDERSRDSHVSRIRRKLGPAAGRLATVWGVGYRLGSER